MTWPGCVPQISEILRATASQPATANRPSAPRATKHTHQGQVHSGATLGRVHQAHVGRGGGEQGRGEDDLELGKAMGGGKKTGWDTQK